MESAGDSTEADSPNRPTDHQASDAASGTASETASRAASRARTILVWGIAATVAATLVLTVLGIGGWSAFGLSLFYLALPAAALAQVPLLPLVEVDRLPLYRGSLVVILGVGAAALVFALLSPVGLAGLRLAFPSAGVMAAWTVGLTLAGIGVMAAFDPLDRRAGGPGSDLVLELIPRTARERRWFVLLSLAAGLGEELAYRGYAFAAAQAVGASPGLAAVVSSLPFAGLHAYQGPVGILRTGLIGLVFAGSVVATGSILPAMAAHALVDIVAGLVIGPRQVARRVGSA